MSNMNDFINSSGSIELALTAFSGSINETPSWANIPAHSDPELGEELDTQTKALAARSELLQTDFRETLRRSYADAGLNLVSGSFRLGFVLNSITDVGVDEISGIAYAHTGPFPKTVPAGSSPTESGFSSRASASDKRLSVRSFNLVCDGVTDDTDAWNAMLPVLNTGLIKAYIPSGCKVFLQAGISMPVAGVIGDGHMSSTIRIKTPVGATTSTLGIIYGTVGNYANSYGRIDSVRIEVDDDTTSPITLVKINTVSRGAGMRDVTLHCGTGYCVGVEDFYYYQFDNVVFEGRFIADASIGPANPLKGRAFKQMGNKEINNIQFNKCDFRYLEEAFEAAGTFIGSNAISVNNCAIEKMGRGLGNIAGWLVTFSEGYWERLGLNQSYIAGEATLFHCGAGSVTINKTLVNLGSLPPDRPFIDATLCTVRCIDAFGVRPSAFISTVLKQNTFSSRGILICDNSPIFDELKQPAYTRIAQQHVGGYTGPKNDSVSPLMGSSGYSRNQLTYLAQNITDQFSLPERVVGHLLLPVSSKYNILLKGVVTHNRSDTNANEQMTFTGSALLDTTVGSTLTPVFTNAKTGTEFDSTWDIPVFLRYSGTESGGYRRYEIVFGLKTGRSYSRTVMIPLEVNAIFVSGTDTTIGLVPAG